MDTAGNGERAATAVFDRPLCQIAGRAPVGSERSAAPHRAVGARSRAAPSARWGWLLTRLGAQPYQSWEHGRSWRWAPRRRRLRRRRAVAARLVGDRHERRSPGLNHLAFWAGSAADLDALVAEAPAPRLDA